MTVADIKEYIDNKIKYYTNPTKELCSPDECVKYEFEQIRLMLDELEEKPKAHWKNICSGLKCSQCGNIIQEWGEVVPDYCDCCGAEMEWEWSEIYE